MLRKLSKVLMVMVSILGVGIILLFVFFGYYKDDIARNIILNANNKTQGELVFDNIYLSPFAHFPHFSITLEQVHYYARANEKNDSTQEALIRLTKAYLALDLISIIKAQPRITGLKIEDGAIMLKRLADGSFNIANAMQLLNQQTIVGSSEEISAEAEVGSIDFSIDYFILEDIDLYYSDEIGHSIVNLDIESLHASYRSSPDTIQVSINSKMLLKHLTVNNKLELENQNLELSTDIDVLRKDSLLHIKRSAITINQSAFHMDGDFYFGNEKNLDLQFELEDADMSFANLFLSPEGVESIQSSHMNFNARIRHDFTDQLPYVDVNVDFGDLNLRLPQSDLGFKDLNFLGSFSSGQADDLSDAFFIIDTLYARTNNGHIHASAKLENLVQPYIESNLDMQLDLTDFEKVFRFNALEDLKGSIGIIANFKLEKRADSSWHIYPMDSIGIDFQQLSFSFPDLLDVHQLDGLIAGALDELKIEKLKLEIGHTDLEVNGELLQGTQFLTSEIGAFEANLNILCDTFDLVELMSWIRPDNSSIRNNFPYPFIDIDIALKGKFSRAALASFEQMPEIYLDIDQCNAEIDGFLPPVQLSNGYLKFSEIDSTLVIDANDFDISFDKGKLKGGCIYYSNLRAQDSIQVNAQLYKLDPGYFLGFMFQDSTLNGDATFLDTKASTHITFSKTGIDEMFENISVTINELVYEFPNDTLKGDALYINVDNLFYDKDTVPRPLSSLSAGINLDIGKLSSKGLYLSQFSSKISIKDGEFDMFINKNQSLFTNGEGRIIYAPFNEMPYFKISYGATGFKFDQLFERLNRKPVVDGNLKVQLAIEGKGKDWEQMSRSIQGNILLEGKDLKMKGFNLDKFTAKFRRSQNFNLLDLGAVVLAGPLGLLVTKGSDLTRLLINNKNDSTEIIQLRTELQIESGLLKLQDVAFSTAENLFALRGGYDLPTDSLGLIIAVLDKDGDVKVQQLVSGTGRYPKLSDIGPISTLLKPVGNLFNDLLPPEDADFYNGKVSHPKAKK